VIVDPSYAYGILLIYSSGSRESALNICDVYLSSSTAIEVASEPFDLQMGGTDLYIGVERIQSHA
jgi:hypothetical protein